MVFYLGFYRTSFKISILLCFRNQLTSEPSPEAYFYPKYLIPDTSQRSCDAIQKTRTHIVRF